MAGTSEGMAAGGGARPRTSAQRAGRPAERPGDGLNVNGIERALSLAAGGLLASLALKRKDWSALPLGVVGGMLVERGVTGHCMVYDALGVSTTEADGGRRPRLVQQHGDAAVLDAQKAIKVERSMTVSGRTPAELYAHWRNFENLGRIFRHIERVEVLDDRRSRWTAKAPAGTSVSWEAEIINEIPNELIAWKSTGKAQVPNAGSVRFREAPGGRGTEIRVVVEYEPPAGKLGALVARMFGEEPAVQVREDLRRFKALAEAGEIPVSDSSTGGKRAGPTHDAQVNRGVVAELGELQRQAARNAHQPRHQPTPSDAARGGNTTHDYEEPRA